jgi:hypothetical protein
MNKEPNPSDSQLLLYQSPSGDIKLDVHLESETVWLKKFGISEFQQKAPDFCINSTYKEFPQVGADSVVRNFRTTAPNGKEFDKSPTWGGNTIKNVCTYSHIGETLSPQSINPDERKTGMSEFPTHHPAWGRFI